MFKDKLIKKSFKRRLKSRNWRFFATHAKSVETFIMFFFNDMNQSIANDKDKEKKSIKIFNTSILRSNTIMFYFKTINFFQMFLKAKDRYNIKINTNDFVFFYFRDRQFFEKDLKQFVFVNKKNFLKEIKINFHIAWKNIKNVTIYFFKY